MAEKSVPLDNSSSGTSPKGSSLKKFFSRMEDKVSRLFTFQMAYMPQPVSDVKSMELPKFFLNIVKKENGLADIEISVPKGANVSAAQIFANMASPVVALGSDKYLFNFFSFMAASPLGIVIGSGATIVFSFGAGLAFDKIVLKNYKIDKTNIEKLKINMNDYISLISGSKADEASKSAKTISSLYFERYISNLDGKLGMIVKDGQFEIATKNGIEKKPLFSAGMFETQTQYSSVPAYKSAFNQSGGSNATSVASNEKIVEIISENLVSIERMINKQMAQFDVTGKFAFDKDKILAEFASLSKDPLLKNNSYALAQSLTEFVQEEAKSNIVKLLKTSKKTELAAITSFGETYANNIKTIESQYETEILKIGKKKGKISNQEAFKIWMQTFYNNMDLKFQNTFTSADEFTKLALDIANAPAASGETTLKAEKGVKSWINWLKEIGTKEEKFKGLKSFTKRTAIGAVFALLAVGIGVLASSGTSSETAQLKNKSQSDQRLRAYDKTLSSFAQTYDMYANKRDYLRNCLIYTLENGYLTDKQLDEYIRMDEAHRKQIVNILKGSEGKVEGEISGQAALDILRKKRDNYEEIPTNQKGIVRYLHENMNNFDGSKKFLNTRLGKPDDAGASRVFYRLDGEAKPLVSYPFEFTASIYVTEKTSTPPTINTYFGVQPGKTGYPELGFVGGTIEWGAISDKIAIGRYTEGYLWISQKIFPPSADAPNGKAIIRIFDGNGQPLKLTDPKTKGEVTVLTLELSAEFKSLYETGNYMNLKIMPSISVKNE